ncbi:MAG: hypothetical protein Q4F43_03970, partial [Eubacteriales bacterium]|nr:hypothetical protein [Eubacteriales bacterium]
GLKILVSLVRFRLWASFFCLFDRLLKYRKELNKFVYDILAQRILAGLNKLKPQVLSSLTIIKIDINGVFHLFFLLSQIIVAAFLLTVNAAVFWLFFFLYTLTLLFDHRSSKAKKAGTICFTH